MADPVVTPSMIPAVDPQGNLVNIPEEQIPLAQQQGFRPPTADEWAKHLEAVQYGGAGQAAIAGLEGAASGLTFGLAPLAERALGVSPEAMRARKEQNPVAHGVGEAIGVIAPIVATLGAAAPAEAAGQVAGRAAAAGAAKAAAEFTAPSLIAKAGQATAKLAESAGAGRILSSTAGAAVEGGLFGAGNVVEQAAMEDPDLTAEKAISEIGLSAVLGGAIGGGATAATQGLGAVIGKARQGFESMAARVAKGDSETVKFMFEYRHDIAALDEVVPGAAQSIANAPKPVAEFILKNSSKIQKLEESFPGVTDVLSRAEPDTAKVILDNWDKVLKDPQRRIAIGNALEQDVNTTYRAVEDALRSANQSVRPAENARLLAGVDPDVALGAAGEVRDNIAGLASTMRAEKELYSQNIARELELIAEGMERDAPATAEAAFDLLNRTKQLVDAHAKFGKMIPPELRRTANALKALRTDIKKTLENEELWGEAGARQAAFNEAQSAYFTAKKAISEGPSFQKLMQKKVTPSGAVEFEANPRSINSWINLMADGRGTAKSATWDEYLKASKALADEMEKSGAANAGEVRAAVEAAVARSKDIRQSASVTQLVKTLQGHEIMSSGPAIPIPKDLIAMAGQSAAQHTLGGGITGAVTSTIERVRNPAMMTGVLSSLDKLAMRAQAVIGTKVSALFEAGAAAGAAGTASQVVSARNFERVAGDIQRHSDVNLLSEKVGRETGPMADVAPQHADAFNMLAARALQHLNAKLPKSIGDRRPLDKPYQPSKGEIAKFNRHYTITQNPSAIFEHIARGTLTPEHVETMQIVYPKLLEHTKAQVIEQMSAAIARGKDIPYRTRLMLSLYLGTDVDSTVDVATLQANQASYAQGQIAPTNTNGGAQSLSIAGRIATPMQSSAERTG